MRQWKMLLLVGVIGLAISVCVAAAPLVNDNFNNAKAGDKPADYLIQEDGGKVELADVPGYIGKSLFLYDPGATSIKITKKFTPQTEIVTVDLAFLQPNAGNTTKVLQLTDDATTNVAVHIETSGNKLAYKNAGDTFTSMVPYNSNEWYAIKVVADVTTQKADVYVNGIQYINQAPFYVKVANIGALLSFTPGSSAKGHFLDNIRVVSGKDTTPIVIPEAVKNATSSADGLITDLDVKDARTAPFWSLRSNLQSGDAQFGDRSFAIIKLPAQFAGSTWIRTSADSKFFFGELLATFKVTKDADVYVCFDDRVMKKPAWVDGWEPIKDATITNSDQTGGGVTFTPYKKHFAAGSTISLGPNGQSQTCIHYMVIVIGPNKPNPPKVTSNVPTPTPTPEAIKVAWNNALSVRPDWYKSEDAIRIADNVLLFQRVTGGWYKYVSHDNDVDNNIAAVLSPADKEKYLKDKQSLDSTFDNKATYTQIRYLAKVYSATKLERFRDGFNKGLDFIFKAQYANGGWPQYYPDNSMYRAHITYNDDAMINIMWLLKDITDKKPDFTFVDKERLAKANAAMTKGVDCILKTQIRVNGSLTAWCQQHDENTLAPAYARAYELPSICTQETTGIIRFLMSIDKPSPQVIATIQSAVAWLDKVKLTGIKLVQKPDSSQKNGTDLVVEQDPNAAPLWARFYDIGTFRPFFVGRDGVKKYSVAEIEAERRNGYSWYNVHPALLLLRDYPAWQAKWAPKDNVLKK